MILILRSEFQVCRSGECEQVCLKKYQYHRLMFLIYPSIIYYTQSFNMIVQAYVLESCASLTFLWVLLVSISGASALLSGSCGVWCRCQQHRASLIFKLGLSHVESMACWVLRSKERCAELGKGSIHFARLLSGTRFYFLFFRAPIVVPLSPKNMSFFFLLNA